MLKRKSYLIVLPAATSVSACGASEAEIQSTADAARTQAGIAFGAFYLEIEVK